MPCRVHEIPLMYFGRMVLENLEKEGIEVTRAIISSIYDFLRKYKVEIDERFDDENFFSKVYSRIKDELGI